jgi:hypothetical protein
MPTDPTLGPVRDVQAADPVEIGTPYEVEMSSVCAAPAHVEAARPLLTIIAVGAMIFGAIISGMGIVLVYLRTSGVTEIQFFGQSFDSSNVGIGAIFLGAATVVIVLTKLMKRLKELAALPKNW